MKGFDSIFSVGGIVIIILPNGASISIDTMEKLEVFLHDTEVRLHG